MISALSKSTIEYQGEISGFHPICLKTYYGFPWKSKTVSAFYVWEILEKHFLVGLSHCFWSNFRLILSINGYSTVIDGSQNIKCREFCVKILHRDYREIVKQLQTMVPCEIQKIAKYIFQKWLFLQTKLLIYMCMCICICVCFNYFF